MSPAVNRWPTVKLKRIVALRAGDGISADQITDEGEYPVYGGNGIRGYSSAFTHTGEHVLIGRQGALCGNVNRTSGRFWASEHAVVGAPVGSVDVRWLAALLESMNLNQYSQSAAQPGLSVDVIANLAVTVPPVAEQQAIANYLDRETARIDALIAAKQRMRTLRHEHESALVSALAVPTGCRFVHLRYLATLQTGVTVDGGRDVGDDAVTRPYLRVANVQSGHLKLEEVTTITVPAVVAARATLRDGDVVMTEGGDIDKLGRGTVWRDQIRGCLHQNHIFAVRPDPKRLDADYLALLSMSAHARAYFESTGVQSTNLASTSASKIMSLGVPAVTLGVQREIVERWNQESAATRSLGESLDRQVRLLNERRRALITAAVTGELRIPMLA